MLISKKKQQGWCGFRDQLLFVGAVFALSFLGWPDHSLLFVEGLQNWKLPRNTPSLNLNNLLSNAPFGASLPSFSDENNNKNTKKQQPWKITRQAQQLEDELLDLIRQESNRLSNSQAITSLIAQLEALPSIPEPAVAPQIYGRWRLLYTTNANTSSPIQRKAVDTKAFPIYQDILIVPNNSNNKDSNLAENVLLVNQVVQFSENSQLCVSALASTAAYPLPLFTGPRQTTGKVLGINVLGVSLVGPEAQPDPNRPNARIDFVFDEGYFDLQGGALRIPYPVPFRLPILRDWVKGWIDITWLSDRVRISRGNKGTTFVLIKEPAE